MAKSAWSRWRILVSRTFVGIIIAISFFSVSRWEVVTPLATSGFFMAGMVLVGIASLGRLWCSLYIAGRKSKTLVTEGPYSLCRHPLYFFSFLGMTGVGLTTETLLLPVLLIAGFAFYYPPVMRHEERKLRSRHGQAYEDYAKSVPFFFPRISHLVEPAEYFVNPIVFRRHIFSALWFIWLTGIAETIEQFHELNWLPSPLHIY